MIQQSRRPKGQTSIRVAVCVCVRVCVCDRERQKVLAFWVNRTLERCTKTTGRCEVEKGTNSALSSPTPAQLLCLFLKARAQVRVYLSVLSLFMYVRKKMMGIYCM